MSNRLKVALIAFYPASAVLPEEEVKPSYRNREHAAPWINALGRGLAARDDVDFHVFVHSRAVTRVCRGSRHGIDFTFVPKREPLRSDPYHLYWPGTLVLRPLIDQYAPDLVHGFGAEGGCGLIASRMSRPMVFFIQGIIEKYAPYIDRSPAYIIFKRLIERRVIKLAVGIVAETNFARDWALGVRADAHVRVIPHALNEEFLSAAPTFAEPLALCVGGIDLRKGADTVIDAFIRVARANPAYRLDMIGGGPLRDALQRRVDEAGLGAQIRFCGHLSREQIIQRMGEARVVIVGSRMDTSPNIVTEAHAAGLPVIGADAGGVPEMITDGKDGFVVPVGDVEAMAGRIVDLMDRPERACAFGEAGREKVLVLNHPQTVANHHVALYRDVLASAQGHAG